MRFHSVVHIDPFIIVQKINLLFPNLPVQLGGFWCVYRNRELDLEQLAVGNPVIRGRFRAYVRVHVT